MMGWESELLRYGERTTKAVERIADALDPPHGRDAKVIDGERLEVLVAALGREVIANEADPRVPQEPRVRAIELDTLLSGLVAEGGRLVVERPAPNRLGR